MKTSLYTLLCLVIRLGAVLMAVHTIQSVFWIAVRWHMDGTAQLPALAFGAAGFLLAAALWLWPGLLARLAAGRSAYQVFEMSLSVAALQRVSFAVVGVWWVIDGLGGVVGRVLQIATLERYAGRLIPTDWSNQLGWLAFYAVTAVAGAVLLMGHRRLVSWLRYAGNPQPAVVEQPPE